MNLIELSQKLDDLIDPEKKRKHTLPKWGALFGAGTITGAGIATGSVATRQALERLAKTISPAYSRTKRYIRKKI